MKKILSFALVGVLAAAAFSANAGVAYTNVGLSASDTTLTFDEIILAPGTILTNQYAAYGITFDGAIYNSQGTAFPPATSGNQVGNFSPITSPWSIFFSSDVGEAAFGIATNPNTTTIEVLLNGIVVGSGVGSTDFDGTDFFQITGLTFDEIRLSTSGDQLALIDNLQFTAVSTVPEPGSLALGSLALLGVVAALRRRRSSH
jgi:PEP-CTERM motif